MQAAARRPHVHALAKQAMHKPKEVDCNIPEHQDVAPNVAMADVTRTHAKGVSYVGTWAILRGIAHKSRAANFSLLQVAARTIGCQDHLKMNKKTHECSSCASVE